MERQTQRTESWTWRGVGRRGCTHGESNMETHRLPHVKYIASSNFLRELKLVFCNNLGVGWGGKSKRE